MSYRNDHEATLARADALEREVSRLRAMAATSTDPPKPPARRGVRTAALLAVTAVVAGSGWLAHSMTRTADADVMNDRITAIDTTTNASTLDSCIAAIGPVPGTDGMRLSVDDIHAVEMTGAACRGFIADIATTGLWSPSEKAALAGWAAAEDRLANAISMVGVYHSSSPDRLDGGATAHQLWVEYLRVHRERDAALAGWQRAHGGER